MKIPKDTKIDRILIMQPAFIGDVVLITPLIRETKKIFPQAKLDVLTNTISASLLENNPSIDRLIRHDKNKQFRLLNLIKTIKLGSYDLAISPHSSFRSHLSLFLSGTPLRLGFARGFLNFLLLNLRVPHPKGIHKRYKNLALLSVFSDDTMDGATEIFPSFADYQKAELLLHGLGSVDKTIAIAPGSVWWTKCWPLESYKSLALELCKKGYGIVLIGSKAEQIRTQAIETFCRDEYPLSRILDTAGSCSLLESAAILSKCELLICNDSGALHIANAMRAKVLSFFGPTVQRIGYFPFGEHDFVLEKELDCRPCGSHGGRDCPLGHHNCMNLISVEEALEKALSMLEAELEEDNAKQKQHNTMDNAKHKPKSSLKPIVSERETLLDKQIRKPRTRLKQDRAG